MTAVYYTARGWLTGYGISTLISNNINLNQPMIMENRQLVTDEPVELEKKTS